MTEEERGLAACMLLGFLAGAAAYLLGAAVCWFLGVCVIPVWW